MEPHAEVTYIFAGREMMAKIQKKIVYVAKVQKLAFTNFITFVHKLVVIERFFFISNTKTRMPYVKSANMLSS